MHIIKLNATESTNSYLKNAMLSEVLDDFTVVTANEQTKGRGQRGTTWQSEAGKNLTISILKKFQALSVRDQFLLNIGVSLAVVDVLAHLQVPELSIKWPNDILSGNSKICGILIENMVNRSAIQESVIGIGLNVNQLSFEGLPKVSSLKLLLGRTFELDEILGTILRSLRAQFTAIEGKRIGDVKAAYEALMFRKDKPSTFAAENGELFMGFIRGISDSGKLRVELEDALIREFDLKEILLLY